MDFAGRPVDHATDQFGAALGHRPRLGFGKIHAAKAVFPVSVSGGDQLALQRLPRTGGHRDVGAAGDFQQPERIRQGQFERHVAGHRRQCFDLQLRRTNRQENRERVIYPGVGIDDHTARRRLRAGLRPRTLPGYGRRRRAGSIEEKPPARIGIISGS